MNCFLILRFFYFQVGDFDSCLQYIETTLSEIGKVELFCHVSEMQRKPPCERCRRVNCLLDSLLLQIISIFKFVRAYNTHLERSRRLNCFVMSALLDFLLLLADLIFVGECNAEKATLP